MERSLINYYFNKRAGCSIVSILCRKMTHQLVIVIGRNYTSRLGMIRAAGIAGCNVAVVHTERLSRSKKRTIDSYSKYITNGYFSAQEPDAEGLIRVLLENFKRINPMPILLPTDDYAAATIDSNINRLKDYFFFPSVDLQEGQVKHYMNKALQKELALDSGFEVANGWTSYWRDGVYQIPEGTVYPCFIKPETSYKNPAKSNMQRCDTRKELEIGLSKMPIIEDYSVLIEQYINIDQEYDIPGLALRDVVYLPGIIKKGEIYHGVTATGDMLPMTEYPEIQAKLTSLLKRLNFTGLVDVELFESNGKIYFNELNMRLGASGYALTGSGTNLPGLLIEYFQQGRKNSSQIITKKIHFASEKVLMEKMGDGYLKISDYNRLTESANLTFIKSIEDNRPYVALKKTKKKIICKRIIKRMLKKDISI